MMDVFSKLAESLSSEELDALAREREKRQASCGHFWSSPGPYFGGGHWRYCYLCGKSEDVEVKP